jgi:hypothetical protein
LDKYYVEDKERGMIVSREEQREETAEGCEDDAFKLESLNLPNVNEAIDDTKDSGTDAAKTPTHGQTDTAMAALQDLVFCCSWALVLSYASKCS